MKKLILFAAILFAGVSVVKAQEPTTSTANLSVTLTPIQTITVNASSKDVNLAYSSDENYKAGVSSGALEDHLNIVSTGSFQIKVQAADLTTTDGTKTMPASSILIKAENGTANPFEGVDTEGEFALANDKQLLVKSDKGGTNKTFNITYTGAKDDLYADNYIHNNAVTTYTTTVTYTLSPK